MSDTEIDRRALMATALRENGNNITAALAQMREVLGYLEAPAAAPQAAPAAPPTPTPAAVQAPQEPAPPPPSPPKAAPQFALNGRKRWTPEQRELVAKLLDGGTELEEVATRLGRTVGAIRAAFGVGLIPCKIWAPDSKKVAAGLLATFKRGQQPQNPERAEKILSEFVDGPQPNGLAN